VKAAAQACGAKFPELVAAQWMLESAGGTAFSGKNNPFGLKGSGTACGTTEVYNGETVHITASFIDFPSLKAAINYLVTRWYLDYRGYRGVNHAASANDAAWELKHQGYATDPSYPEKLCRIMKEHA
jgi:flagellum-specific peptidoglycan hydrolase FlgJ